MKRKLVMLVVAAVAIVSLVIVGCAPEVAPPPPPPEEEEEAPPAAPEVERIKWTGTHYMPPGPIMDAALEVAEMVEKMTEGGFTIEVAPSGSILTVPEVIDGVRDGVLECSWIYQGYYVEKLPETIFEGYGVFALTDMDEALIFYEHRGALELLKEAYEEYGVVYVRPLMGGVQGPLVSTVPVPNSKAIAGLTVRSSDVTAHYVTELGGSNVFVPIGEAYTLMAAGTVDAAAGVGLADWYATGMADIAKYWVMTPPIVPGWTDTFIAHPDAWEALPESYKVMLEEALDASFIHLKVRQEAEALALRPILVEEGVTLIDWPAEDQDIFAKLAVPIVEEAYIHTPRTDKLMEMFKDFIEELYG